MNKVCSCVFPRPTDEDGDSGGGGGGGKKGKKKKAKKKTSKTSVASGKKDSMTDGGTSGDWTWRDQVEMVKWTDTMIEVSGMCLCYDFP